MKTYTVVSALPAKLCCGLEQVISPLLFKNEYDKSYKAQSMILTQETFVKWFQYVKYLAGMNSFCEYDHSTITG